MRGIEMHQQLPLTLRWPRRQRFQHFHAAGNTVALAAARHLACEEDAPWVLLAGPAGSGKTHLLVAACQAALDEGRRVQYLPLARVGDNATDALRGSGGVDLLALDDVQSIAGNAAAEHALFDVYNRCRAEGAAMLLAASAPPRQLAFDLPDLRSRLGALTVALLKPLGEAARRDVLHEHARARGMQLDATVMDWLFAHHARDLGALHDLLDRLDEASLAAKRRITVPFLRTFLHHRTSERE